MPKNLSTIGGATKLRFGKNCREDQAENSIVFNASEDKIDATVSSGVYITPLELATHFENDGSLNSTNTLVVYNQHTHQLFRTIVPLSLTGISSAVETDSSGDVTVTGDLFVQGNVTSIGTVANIHVTNTMIKDGLVEIGSNNTDLATFDLGHVYNRGPNGSNVALYYDASESEFSIAYTSSSAMEHTQVTPHVDEMASMNVHVYGKIFTESNIGVINTSPVHSLSVSDSVFIDSNTESNVIIANGDTYTKGNMYISGGIITNLGGVNKKTYSYAGDIPPNTPNLNAKIKIKFTKHVFYAKIIAQLIDDLDHEVSTLTIDVAGGERGGDNDPSDIAQGPLSIFGTANNSNPWSSEINTNTTEVIIKPSETTGAECNYTIFIEYLSHNLDGRVESINPDFTDIVDFDY